MSTTPARAYRGKSAAMLVGIAAIAENALRHAAALQEANSTFTEAYFRELRSRIDGVAKRVLGADNAAALRSATSGLQALAGRAAAELRLTKGWIESKFAANPVRRDALLAHLGFQRFYAAAVNRKQQEDLGQLLERVGQGIDATLEQELVAAGLPQARIAAIRELAAEYNAGNVRQESEKSQRTARTAADVEALNAIYTEVMGVSKLARKVLSAQPVIRDSFAFEAAAPAPHARPAGTPDA
jgi:hypothetical protein